MQLPASVNQINNIIVNNIVKKEFKINSSLKINNYQLDKNSRRLIKNNQSLELTEKEIELIELLYNEKFIKKMRSYQKYGIIQKMPIHTQLKHTFIDLEKRLKKCLMMKFLSEVKKKVIQFEKRNKFAKDLMTPKYRSRVVKPKKGKGSFIRKKRNKKSEFN